MKKIFIITLLLLSFTGCHTKTNETTITELDFNALDCVVLYDYSEIRIKSDELTVDNSDINAVVSMELATKEDYVEIPDRTNIYEKDMVVVDILSNDIKKRCIISDFNYYVGSELFEKDFDNTLKNKKVGDSFDCSISFPENFPEKSIAGQSVGCVVNIKHLISKPDRLTDELAYKYYGANTVDEAREKIKGKIINGRIFDIAFNIILEKSYIKKMPDYYKVFMTDFDIKDSTESNTSSLEKEAESFFSEYLIIKAITEQLNIFYTQKDWDNTLHDLAEEAGTSEDEIFDNYGTVGICYEMMLKDLKKQLPKYVTIE